MEQDYTTIHVLGAEWKIISRTVQEDEYLASADGYADWTVREIVLRAYSREKGEWKNFIKYRRKVLRHEIIHAFLYEAGLAQETTCHGAWATNEEMVDWFAFNGLKIYAAWKEADALG